jgi:hypothetical protein
MAYRQRQIVLEGSLNEMNKQRRNKKLRLDRQSSKCGTLKLPALIPRTRQMKARLPQGSSKLQ